VQRRARKVDPIVWTPPGGSSYQLRVVDDHGRADTRELRVALTQ
jgi:hypothetical protein